MPNGYSVNRRIVNVEAGRLPPPATKLIITQILKASQDPPFWAWIIVGAFYDSEGRTLWSTELFVAHLDIQFESDEEQVSEEEAETETAPEPESGNEAEAEPEFEGEEEPGSPPVQSPEVHRSVTPELRHPRPSAYSSRPIDAYEGYNSHSPFYRPYLHRLYPHIHHYSSPHSNPHGHYSPPNPHYHQHHNHHHNYHRPPPHWLSALPFIHPPTAWDPALSGPIPGHWHASFDSSVGRWVHTWQPRPLIPYR